MSMHLRWWVIPALACVVTTGCGTKSDTVDKPKAPYPDVVSYCQARAKAECSVAVRCGTTEDKCIAKRTGVCSQNVPAGGVYQSSEAKACLEAIKKAYSDDEYTAAESRAEMDACGLLFGGTGGLGASCLGTYQCDLGDDLRCIIPTGEVKGQCQVPVPRNPGDACDAVDDQCATNTFCTATEPHVCANKMGDSKTCGPTLPCQDELRCLQIGDQSTCKPRLDIGSLCTENTQCASELCGKVGDATQCVATLVFSPNEPICEDFRP